MSVFFLYGFSLIVRLVREVIKITRGVLARVFFWGFGGWNRGRFWGFWSILRKCSISSFLNPFFIFSHLRLLIFRIFQNPRHFRTARSGVYMGAGLTDSVIRFGFLVEWGDAHFSGLIPLLRLPAATASRVGGLLNVFLCYLTAPPERSLSRRSETAGEVRKGLGFGVHPLRLQKTASLLHPLSRIAEFCFRLLLRFRSLTRPASSAHPSFLLSQVSSSLAPYASA